MSLKRDAQRYKSANKYEEAANAYRRILELTSEPRTAESYCDLGGVLLCLGQYPEAKVEFGKALDIEARSTRALKGRGDAEAGMAQYDDAMKSYKEAADAADGAGQPGDAARAYNDIGDAFYGLRRFGDAAENFQKAADKYEALARAHIKEGNNPEAAKNLAVVGDMYNNLGYARFALRQYEGARAAFTKATQTECAVKYPYAYHTLASLYWKQGKYGAAMEQWRCAYERYDQETRIEEARSEGWYGHFESFGNLLHDVFGEFDKAEKMYLEARRMAPANPWIMIGLMNLYLEKAENSRGVAGAGWEAKLLGYERRGGCADPCGDAYWKAKALYEKAEKELMRTLSVNEEHFEARLALGELYLTRHLCDGVDEQLKKAEEHLLKAQQLDEARGKGEGYTRSPKPSASLGVLHMRRKEYSKAISSFRQALFIDHDDLVLRSNLAEAYLRAGQLDDAEREYRSILGAAPEHVESLIGMAEVCVEGKDVDRYDEAVTLLDRAVKLGDLKKGSKGAKGSKRLRNKELAKVHYLKAYARVEVFKASKLFKETQPLYAAREDLQACCKADPELHLAKRSLDKIEKSLPASAPQRLLERWGPFCIVASSFVVLVLVQLFFFADVAKFFGTESLKSPNVSGTEYTALTFGALGLMAVGIYLPQVLKLKVAGMELEKGTVDQISTLGTLGIPKGT